MADRFIPNRKNIGFLDQDCELFNDRNGVIEDFFGGTSPMQKYEQLLFEVTSPEIKDPKNRLFPRKRPLIPDPILRNEANNYMLMEESMFWNENATRDFYATNIDWSAKNQLAYSSYNTFYLMNYLSEYIYSVWEVQTADNAMIYSIRFDKSGDKIGLGVISSVYLYDPSSTKIIRNYATPMIRKRAVTAIKWDHENMMTMVGDFANILRVDNRMSQPMELSIQREMNTSRWCNLSWNADETKLALGSNDNEVVILDYRNLESPIETYEREAAVKAIDWHPINPNILAMGGGQADYHIHIENIATKKRLNTIVPEGQTTSLLWSLKHTDNLFSTHGFGSQSLNFWKSPISHTMKTMNYSLHRDNTKNPSRVWNVVQNPTGGDKIATLSESGLCIYRLVRIPRKNPLKVPNQNIFITIR